MKEFINAAELNISQRNFEKLLSKTGSWIGSIYRILSLADEQGVTISSNGMVKIMENGENHGKW